MNDQVYQVPPKKGAKPGEWLLIIGILLLLIGPFIYFAAGSTTANMKDLKQTGVAYEGTVKDKQVKRESYTDSKGRSKTRTSHILSVSYDLNSSTKYIDLKAGKPAVPSQYPAITSQDISVSSSTYEANAIGQKAVVVWKSGASDTMELASDLEYYVSGSYVWLNILISGALTLIGAALTYLGAKKRFFSHAI